MKDNLRVLMIGDVSGSAGMGALFIGLSSLIRDKKADFVIINGENAAGGFGITREDYASLKSMGADVITSGNHIWQKEEILPLLDSSDDILRPINYPDPCVGKGWTIKKKGNIEIGVINAQGRMSMSPIDDPMKRTDQAVREIRKRTPLIFVDFHAEDTVEKEAFAFYLDGKVSAVCGTHTHVQTADEKILPKGTAYITDLGLTGVTDAVIGSDPAKSIERQLTQLPIKSEVASGEAHIQGVVITVNAESGKAESIERFTL
ncbi:MAG: TIGR00282 family metallophosphoesterase [Spirochaetes bacterium]|uniref:TIGR00282 family metallophosphoesterase n=1 Tax=Candidatus Ornithospirochaeta stercoravium TaxID=2840897 RepID=A0A9D9IAY8_9SPIO|nr:TIGR00282 family metallophosphoesterase [Candidatus Ornithospirochaeta stercoravium]